MQTTHSLGQEQSATLPLYSALYNVAMMMMIAAATLMLLNVPGSQHLAFTWFIEGRFSLPFLANVSSPLSEENKPFLLRTLCDRDRVRFLRAASSREQI